MALYPIVKYPKQGLFKPTETIDPIGEKEKLLARDMIETMHHERGVGLAANQIGISKRIFVASADGVRGKELVCINPEIIRKSGRVRDQEGCLSIPGYFEPVTRYRKVTLRAQDLTGKIMEMKAEGLLARIFQHETDHLNGYLYVHRLSFFKKKKLIKKLDHELKG